MAVCAYVFVYMYDLIYFFKCCWCVMSITWYISSLEMTTVDSQYVRLVFMVTESERETDEKEG